MQKLTIDEFIRLCDKSRPKLYVCRTIEDALVYQGEFRNMSLVASVKALMFWNSFCAIRFSGITYITVDCQPNGDLACEMHCEDADGGEHIGRIKLIYGNVCDS